MKTIMAEFSGKRAGFFRPKPVYKFGGNPTCPRCGSRTHVGKTTCIVQSIRNREKPMNQSIALQATQTLETINAKVKDYLQRLQDAEASIINQDKDIASGKYNCFHYRPVATFHFYNPYAPYSRMPIKFKIEGFEEQGVEVNFDDTKILVPYAETPKSFQAHCNQLFAKAKEDMNHCFQVKQEAVKQANQQATKDKRIRSPHTLDSLTYRWEDCKHCNGRGTVQVGTGEMEDDPFSYADSPGQREITVTKNCPCCYRTQGLLIFTENGATKEREIPCARCTFEEFEDKPLKIILANARIRDT